MNGKSLTPEQEKLKALKEILPEVFTEGKVDWEKLQATLGEDINFSNERYVLNWAGKSDAFKVLQAPTTKTLIPAKDESINFDATEHVFIEGDNLEALKVLQKSYFGKVKMIYIDPPYNTGNDSFIYPDKFSETIAEYEQRVGDKDEDGYMTTDGMFKKNSKENGQYHSNWLNMMMPRLYLAKNLLKQDGVIFISIDDNEVHNLKMLMNEIFGEENFLANVVWQKKYAATNDAKGFSNLHDHIIVYQKSDNFERLLLPRTDEQNKPYKNDDKDGRGLWRSDNLLVRSYSKSGVYPIKNPNTEKEYFPAEGSSWRASKETMQRWLSENRVFFGKDGKGAPQLKRYLNEVQQGRVPTTWWTFSEVGHNDAANKELKKLFQSKPPFDTPKPTTLIKQILKISTSPNDLILDFFAGSGTTADAVMQLNAEDGWNRKCISIQLPELCEEASGAYKVGYQTIAEISKERIRRASKKIQEENPDYTGDLGFKVLKLVDSNFKQWRQIDKGDIQALEEQMEMFVDPVTETATTENIMYELLLKSGKDLNSNIIHQDNAYFINENELVFILETANQTIIDTVIAKKPEKVIALDRLFKGNDQLKTNTALQMKDANIAFKTI